MLVIDERKLFKYHVSLYSGNDCFSVFLFFKGIYWKNKHLIMDYRVRMEIWSVMVELITKRNPAPERDIEIGEEKNKLWNSWQKSVLFPHSWIITIKPSRDWGRGPEKIMIFIIGIKELLLSLESCRCILKPAKYLSFEMFFSSTKSSISAISLWKILWDTNLLKLLNIWQIAGEY